MKRLLRAAIPFVLAAGILLGAALLAGCSGGPQGPASAGSRPENPALEESPAELEFIELTAEITGLDSGFSAVRHDGEDGFAQFLAQGGAASDQEVLQFLVQNGLQEAGGLSFGGAPFGCSTISVENTDGGWYFGRNFDWNTCDALVFVSYPPEDYASISTVNLDFIRQGAGPAAGLLSDPVLSAAALYAPLDGMNEQGLCVSVNMIGDSAAIDQDTGRPDLTTTTAIRLLLNKAATVEEALALLKQYDLHASMGYMVHFAIADSAGSAVAVEYVADEMQVIDTPILTNFYLAQGSKYGIGTRQSHTRFEILARALEETPTMTAPQVQNALGSVSKGNFGEFESTEWSVIFDQSAKTAIYYHCENYEQAYAFALQE